MHGVGATDRLGTRFGKAEVPDLALLNQLLDGACHIFDGHLRIDTVLVEQIDHVGLESLQRRLGDLLDVLWPAVEAGGCGELEAEFHGDHHLVSERSKGFAHELFIGERPVDFSGVEEGDSAIHGCGDD